MRTKVHAPFMRALSQASAVVLIGGLATACSNDVLRFDESLVTNTGMTANQHAVMRSQAPVQQPFPGDVDTLTTASVKAKPLNHYTSASRVTRPVVTPPVALGAASSSSSPKTAFSNGVAKVKSVFTKPSTSVSTAKTSVSNVYQTAKQSVKSPTKAVVSHVVASKGMVLAPRNTKPVELKLVGTDTMSTGSVVRPTNLTPAKVVEVARAGSGWNGAGGTWVDVKQGETLYNLSRRYGVPVEALMKANSITGSNSLAAGSRIMVPAYTYNKQAKVSAPDSNPMTSASRASTGFAGQARTTKVAVPKPRAVLATAKTVPVPTSARPAISSSSKSHVVASGETLYSISRKYGVTTAALVSQNQMSNTIVRLGQKITIPAAGTSAPSAIVAKANKIDPVTTASVPTSSGKTAVSAKKLVKPVYNTPEDSLKAISKAGESATKVAKTNSSAFRWPIRGRVIYKFGERINGSTNDGIDISVPVGTPVKATENGTVIYSGSELADFGNLILVSHSGGWVSAYAHASKNRVKRGDKVNRGQVIAISGKSGNATKPKLHFELRKNSTPVDPLKYLSKY